MVDKLGGHFCQIVSVLSSCVWAVDGEVEDEQIQDNFMKNIVVVLKNQLHFTWFGDMPMIKDLCATPKVL